MADLVAPVARTMVGSQDIAPEVERNITYDDLDWSPVATFLTQVHGVETVLDEVFNWSEQQAINFSVTLTGAISGVGAGTEQTVTFNSGNVVVGDVFYHTTSKQQFRVTEWVAYPTATTTQCKIVRISESLATVAVAGTPTLRYKSNQITENGYFPIGKGSTPTWYYNYIQTMTNVVGISWRNRKIPAYWGDQLSKYMYEANRQHRSNFERDFWWAEAISEVSSWTNEDGFTSNGRVTQTQGFDSRITTHSTSYGGTLTEPTFNDWLAQHVWNSRNSGSAFKMLVCGPGVMRALNSFATNRLNTYQGATQYGLDIREYITWGGRSLAIMEECEFYDNADYENTCYAIEPDMMGICALGDYMTQMLEISLPNRAADAFVYWTEAGFKIKQEKKHAKLFKL